MNGVEKERVERDCAEGGMKKSMESMSREETRHQVKGWKKEGKKWQ